MADFKNRLKELRVDKGITQKQMAEYLGMVEQAYQMYEYGKREPNHETTMKLADLFEVSVDYLLGRVNFWYNKEGRITVKVLPDILGLGTTDEELAEIERKAKEKWEKSVKVRKKK